MTDSDPTDATEDLSRLRSLFEADELTDEQFGRKVLRVVHYSPRLELRDATEIIDDTTDIDVYDLEEKSPPINPFKLQPPAAPDRSDSQEQEDRGR